MNDFMSMTQIGRLVGGTCQEVGALLRLVRLRNRRGNPTFYALEHGYVKAVGNGRPNHNGTFYLWHTEKT